LDRDAEGGYHVSVNETESHDRNDLSVKRLLLVALVLLPATALLAADDPRENARALAPGADAVVAAIDSGDRAVALERWRAFEESWSKLEDPIRGLSPALYRRIEERMQDVSGDFPREGDWQPADARAALADIRSACLAVAMLPDSVTPKAEAPVSLGTFVETLGSAARDARGGQAKAAFERANEGWFAVEGTVKTRDVGAYALSETALGEARAAARRDDGTAVATALERIQAAVTPLEARSGHVGSLDAAAIILREGLEALLILAAIAAFLARIGAGAKARVVWAGGALGLLASFAGAALLVRVFTGVAAGERREVVEGFSGLLAAVLLVVVGQWLHEKIRRGGWKTQVQQAHESGRTLSLLLVAFLAVFREGAETVVFLAGIAPSSTPREMLLGSALGLGALVVLGAAILALGRRLPLGPFLTATTFLLWALAVKFAGGGIVALQTGGLVSATRFAGIPEVPALGFAPTLESAGAQLAVILAWTALSLVPRLRRRAKLERSEERVATTP
jgi:high-affinity iron transporter